MPRPLKHPSVRQRRNAASSAATLHALAEDEIVIPELPTRLDNDGKEILWSSATLRWWLRIWSSPMAPEFYNNSDIEGLYRMAALVELFWRKPSGVLNAEISRYEDKFGLNPLARRRLEWQIVDTEKAQEQASDRHARKASRPPAATVEDATDPSDPLSA
jgi:hypothetical protein